METFVVRVFVPADGADGVLRGVVEHVASGEAEPFTGLAALIRLVRRRVECGATTKPARNQRGEP